MKLYLRDDIAKAWQGNDIFKQVLQQQGEIFRDKEGRRTMRCKIAEKSYFLKVHQGVGWGEIFKNLLQGRLPVIGASNEVAAIRAFEKIGLKTLTIAACGERGINPAAQQSFLLTDELTNVVSLEDFCRNWVTHSPSFTLKRNLIRRIADIASKMHLAGINHRDFYLCHFLLDISSPVTDESIKGANIYVIDLHRAQIRSAVPVRWLIKDLGGLYYSAMDIGLSWRDLCRFMHYYNRGVNKQSLRKAQTEQRSFWKRVLRRATQIYRRDNGCDPSFVSIDRES